MTNGPSGVVRIVLKGVASATKRLADGSTRTYHYAWRGGPALPGAPGSPEFVAAYHAAHAGRRGPTGGLVDLLADYRASPAFADLAVATRRDYARHLAAIQREFGDLPIAALADHRVRGDFLRWRDRLAVKSRRQADYALTVLARVLSWATDRGAIARNPLERPGRVYRGGRADRVWTDADEAAFAAAAPPHLALALVLAAETGQRQGDLLRLTWTAYDGKVIRLRQSKTGVRVVVPVTQRLRAALEAARAQRGDAVTILTTLRGTPWTSSGFRASWGKVPVDLAGLTFHDLRGTAVTRLALAGCTVQEIATITGHRLSEVTAVLDQHYLNRDVAMAESAVKKLDRSRKSANRPANRSASVGAIDRKKATE